MKANGHISKLLNTAVHNEHDYYHRVIYPLLDYLSFPKSGEARWPQFPIRNPFGSGNLKLDYLSIVETIPMMLIEGKCREAEFSNAYRQACDYARNFTPAESDVREMVVPYILVAAGRRAQMFRAKIDIAGIQYEPIEGFLEWDDLKAEARPFLEIPRRGQLPFLAGQVGGAASEDEFVHAEFAKQVFDDVYSAINTARGLRRKDDEKIILFNRIIRSATGDDDWTRIQTICEQKRMSQRAITRLEDALSWYRSQFGANQLQGTSAAIAYREFVSKYFTGESQCRPYRAGRRTRYRNVARYFTPTEIIQQMVRLSRITAKDRVIDFTCGSGGFLAEAAIAVGQQTPSKVGDFVTKRLVGIDDDPFCVETTKTLLGFLYPSLRERLKVFLHNGLYQRAPRNGEYHEERGAERHLRPGTYDLVIGNPPGNQRYSGSNEQYVTELWSKRYGITKSLWDHVFFVTRAIELAKPKGGRICVLVPDGFLSNRQFRSLRGQTMSQCELEAVVSLPRVFKGNRAKMSLLYMIRNRSWNPNHKALLGAISLKTQEPDPESREGTMRDAPTNIYAELEFIVDHYERVERENSRLPPGSGMSDITDRRPGDEEQ